MLELYQIGVGQTGLWYEILMMSGVYNSPFGPWEGQALCRNMQEEAEVAFMTLSGSNPLFVSLYEKICHDMGLEPVGAHDHRQMVFNKVFQSE